VNDIVLPSYGSFWTIGDTAVVVLSTPKRGRGYQVIFETPTTGVITKLRLKDFNKKAVPA
jgi:hypothetical protein